MATNAGLAGPDALSDDGRDAIMAVLYRLADDELVLGERYTDWQVCAPTLESDLALANIAQDEFGHARLWYDLLMDFGLTEADLIFERDPASFRHSTLTELPFDEGNWADAIVRGYLYDTAEVRRLETVESSAYRPLRERVEKVLLEERYHREHAKRWLARLAEAPAGHERLQTAVDRLFPFALTLFEPGPHEATIDDLGLRTIRLADLRGDWLEAVASHLGSLDLDVPELDEAALPDAIGRDGSHTEHWPTLHAEMTRTWRQLGRTQADRIMEDPDDVE